MFQHNRRDFLKRTVAGGVLATFVVSGTKASGRVLGANDRVRIAVAGINGRGQSHLRGFGQMEDVEIQTVPVADGVYMLIGAGGNIGLSVGEDGAFIVDDQFAPLTDKINAAIAAVTEREVRFVINTHWHADHTGGNENYGEAGALIVAHENVRERMMVEQYLEAFNSRTPPAPPAALPVLTFNDEVNFFWNGDNIHVFHVDPAHTDGDSFVHWVGANVVHTGDVFRTSNTGYPFIDTSTGGRIDGIIAGANTIISMSSSATKIIPGHGELTDVNAVIQYRDMLSAVRDRVRLMIADGMTRDQIIRAKPTRDFDPIWGGGTLQPDQWVGIVYDSMTMQ